MKQSQLYWLALAVLLALGTMALGTSTALARTNNTITVNSTEDTWNPGDGKCTLREAINNANNDSNTLPNSSPDCAAGNGADVIVLELGSTFALSQVDSGAAPDTNGMPVITSDITIKGNFSSIARDSDAPNMRLFKVNASGKLTLNDLVLSGGQVQADGGALYNSGTLILNRTYVGDSKTLEPGTARAGFGGGGIYNRGLLTLNAATIYRNSTGRGATVYTTQYDGYPGGDGGGVYNAAGATAEISNTTFSLNQTGIGGNRSNQVGPATPVDSGMGGAVYNEGSTLIVKGSISNNLSGIEGGVDVCVCHSYGGGIAVGAGAVTISDIEIANNGAQLGGGIYVALGNAYIFRTLFRGNHGIEGAAIMTGGSASPTDFGALYLVNSTVTGNAADWKADLDFTSARSIISNRGNISIDYSTITDNTVLNQGTIPVGMTTRITHPGASLTLWNTIVSNTINVPNCYQDVSYPIINTGNNLDSGASCGFGSVNGSKSNTDPKLAALADNGGPIWTMAIAADSPARDQGNTTECLYPYTVNNVDQRGFPRIKGVNNSCDIGAYEYGASAPVVEPTVTNTPTMTPTNVPPGPTATPTSPPPSPTPTNTPDPCPEAPFAATLTAPANNTTVTAARVQLKWNPAVCATTYNVVVKLKNKVVDSANDLTTNKFKTKALAAGKTYTWFVQACNVNGCSNSTQFKFIK